MFILDVWTSWGFFSLFFCLKLVVWHQNSLRFILCYDITCCSGHRYITIEEDCEEKNLLKLDRKLTFLLSSHILKVHQPLYFKHRTRTSHSHNLPPGPFYDQYFFFLLFLQKQQFNHALTSLDIKSVTMRLWSLVPLCCSYSLLPSLSFLLLLFLLCHFCLSLFFFLIFPFASSLFSNVLLPFYLLTVIPPRFSSLLLSSLQGFDRACEQDERHANG